MPEPTTHDSSSTAAVVLSGSGVYDGTEITEAVSVLVALDRVGVSYQCYAPDVPQRQVIDHLAGTETGEKRNVLAESARIARGKIRPLEECRADEHLCLIFPGGFGAAKNLCSFAFDGTNVKVEPQVRRVLADFHAAGKPIGLACIAPVLAAAVFGPRGIAPQITIGTDRTTADAINQLGGRHQETDETGIVVDEKNRLVTTPCYMNDVGPYTVFVGANKMVDTVLEMAGVEVAA